MSIQEEIFAALDAHEQTFSAASDLRARPRAPTSHVVYGGAHLFREGTVEKLGRLAQSSFETHAPDAATLAQAIGIESAVAPVVFERVARKLATRPVEDYRIDFEDGYGVRSDEEEDGHAVSSARALATRLVSGPLGAAVGIRIKSLAPASRARAVRTLELFLKTFADAASSAIQLPHDFVVTLPKVRAPFEVEALVRLLADLETRIGLPPIGIELMIETPESLIDPRGAVAMPSLVRAADGRCTALHLGSYDLTSAFGVPAHAQRLDHPLCDFAKALMKASLAGSSLARSAPALSDGATTVLPVGDREAVHAAWRLHADGVRHGLAAGFFQGWDLHPAQLPARFAALFAFFLEALPAMRERLGAFRAESERATRLGQAFDDRATALALETFFHRAAACGALQDSDVV